MRLPHPNLLPRTRTLRRISIFPAERPCVPQSTLRPLGGLALPPALHHVLATLTEARHRRAPSLTRAANTTSFNCGRSCQDVHRASISAAPLSKRHSMSAVVPGAHDDSVHSGCTCASGPSAGTSELSVPPNGTSTRSVMLSAPQPARSHLSTNEDGQDVDLVRELDMPGMTFGDVGVCFNIRQEATVEALTPSQCLVLQKVGPHTFSHLLTPPHALRRLLTPSPAFAHCGPPSPAFARPLRWILTRS